MTPRLVETRVSLRVEIFVLFQVPGAVRWEDTARTSTDCDHTPRLEVQPPDERRMFGEIAYYRWSGGSAGANGV